MKYGIYETEGFGVIDSLLVSLIAILIVFAVLAILILVCSAISEGMAYYDKKTKILAKEENAILDQDEDAVAAVLAATIDFHKETGHDARVISVERIKE